VDKAGASVQEVGRMKYGLYEKHKASLAQYIDGQYTAAVRRMLGRIITSESVEYVERHPQKCARALGLLVRVCRKHIRVVHEEWAGGRVLVQLIEGDTDHSTVNGKMVGHVLAEEVILE